ncbi:MAG: hypothetical protein RIK87_25000 [Fuerstiella sp.]
MKQLHDFMADLLHGLVNSLLQFMPRFSLSRRDLKKPARSPAS